MTTRREFIKNVAVGASALSLGGVLPAFSAKSYKNIAGANEQLRVGVIGVNSRGNALARGFANEKERGCIVTDICDVDSRALERCIQAVTEVAGNRPNGHRDVRKMLENRDIDAVVIATPTIGTPRSRYGDAGGQTCLPGETYSHNPAENQMLIDAEKRYGKRFRWATSDARGQTLSTRWRSYITDYRKYCLWQSWYYNKVHL